VTVRTPTFQTFRAGFCSKVSGVSAPTPPGWFPDPYGAAGVLRWWDGRQWTHVVHPVPPDEGRRRPAGYGQEPRPLGYAQEPLPAGHGRPAPAYGGPAPGPGYEQPPATAFPAPPPAGRRRGGLPWLIGGAGLAAAVAAAAVLVLLVRGGHDNESAAPPLPPPPVSSRAGGAAADPESRSAVIGRVTDRALGISYARLGAPWTAATGGWLRPDFFSAGQVSVVQAPFEQYESFNATSLSGALRPDESVGYAGPRDLPVVGRRVTERILREHFNLPSRRTQISAGPYRVAGRRAWLDRFRLDFTDARARDWKFSADTVAILVLDLGDHRPGLLWVSVPDTFPHQGDVDQVLGSVRVG
jgi:hypothetical protein